MTSESCAFFVILLGTTISAASRPCSAGVQPTSAEASYAVVVKKVASGTEFATEMVTEGPWYGELVKNKHGTKQPGGKAKKLAPGEATPKSRLVQGSIRCLPPFEAKEAIVDESFEPYISQLQRREIAALTAETPTAETLQDCRDQARQRFQDAVLPFTEREEEAIVWLTGEVRDRLAKNYPLFVQQPWWFIKVNNRHCGGFSYTRGLCIVFSQRTVDRVVRARNEKDKTATLRALGPLLVHEQMHVLQRLYPERFANLYTDVFGLVRGQVEPNDWLIERQISNPDGPKLEWIAALPAEESETRYVWPRTILQGTRPVPQMGRDFLAIAVELEKRGGGYRVVEETSGKPQYEPLDGLSFFVQRFPVRRGLDHPNEIAAYMFGRLFSQDCLPDDRQTQPIAPPGDDDSTGGHPGERLFVPFRAWCRKYLKSCTKRDN